jgi:hypothetical protein
MAMADSAVAPADPEVSSTAQRAGQPNPASRLHFLDGEPLLFDERRQKLYALDRTAAFIWCCLEDGLGIDGAAKRLAEAASLNIAAGRALVADAVQRWCECSLLDGDGDVVNGEIVDKSVHATQATIVTLHRPAARAAVVTERRINLAGLDLHLCCPEPEVAQRVLPLFAHLPPPTEAGPAVRIDIRTAPAGYAVFQDRMPVLRIGELAGVAPALKAHLIQTILARPDYRLAVHAAAVAKGGRVLLLPGDSGSGKTTLAAALIVRGFSFLGDDTVVLEQGDLRVRPIPFALAVKAGAWDLLTPYHTRLPELPVDCRPDGKVVRYLRPAQIAAGSLPAAWMVFPVWNGGAAPRLTRLTRVAALQRFLPGCYASAHCLKSAELAQLVRWIEGVECYTIDASDLGAAVGLLDQLCR